MSVSLEWVGALTSLFEEGGDDNHAVFGEEDGYIVARATRGGDEVFLEAPANRHLPGESTLSPSAIERLHAAGFRRQTAARTFSRRGAAGDATALAAEIRDLLQGIYGVTSDSVRVRLGPAEPLQNAALTAAMRRLSRVRDMPARQTLYRALVDARLLLSLSRPSKDPHASQGADLVLRPHGQLGARVSVAGFTDMDTLRRDHPRGLHTVILPGHVFVPLMVAQRVGSLLINPGGDVGGELYANELEAISDYISRRSARH